MNYFSRSAVVFGPLLAVAAIACSVFVKSADFPAWARLTVPIAAVATAAVWVWQRRLYRSGMILQSIGAIVLSAAILARIGLAAGLEFRYQDKYGSLHSLCRIAKTLPEPLALYGLYLPSVFYYTQRPVNCFFNGARLVQKPGRSTCILVKDSQFVELQATTSVPLQKLAQSKDWILCQANNALVKPYMTLDDFFSRLTYRDFLSNRYPLADLGVLTDCTSEGHLWKGDPRLSSRK
jgi:hypothetical protein